MKRHESLIPLSRDHHHGLLCAWKLRQGIKKGVNAERMRPYVKYFYERHLKEHFREEEELLFSNKADKLVQQAIRQHRALESRVAEIDQADTHQFMAFADELDSHIRFEERSLFPHLETSLDPNQLEEIGTRLTALHAHPVADNFEDEFWL